jgi:hypothetical protein
MEHQKSKTFVVLGSIIALTPPFLGVRAIFVRPSA